MKKEDSKYILPILGNDNNEMYVVLPGELLFHAEWKLGDDLEFIRDNDTNCVIVSLIKHKEIEKKQNYNFFWPPLNNNSTNK